MGDETASLWGEIIFIRNFYWLFGEIILVGDKSDSLSGEIIFIRIFYCLFGEIILVGDESDSLSGEITFIRIFYWLFGDIISCCGDLHLVGDEADLSVEILHLSVYPAV